MVFKGNSLYAIVTWERIFYNKANFKIKYFPGNYIV